MAQLHVVALLALEHDIRPFLKKHGVIE